MRKLICLCTLLSVLLTGCSDQSEEQKNSENASATPAIVEAPPINFVVITTGSTTGIKTDMTTIYKLDTEQAFAAFWAEHSRNLQPAQTAPVVDFNKDMIIALVDTDQPSSGYELAVDKLEAVDNKLYLFATRKQPGAGCVNLGMISQPFVMVQVPKSELVPELRLSTETIACQ